MAPKKFRVPFTQAEPEKTDSEPVKSEWDQVNLSQAEQADLLRRIARNAPNVLFKGGHVEIDISPTRRIRVTFNGQVVERWEQYGHQ